MSYTWPSFPTMPSSIQDIPFFLVEIILYPFEMLFAAFGDIIQGGSSGAATGLGNSASAVLGFLGSVWGNSIAPFKTYGIFAPILGSLIWGMGLAILIFFVMMAFHETEEGIEEE